MTTARKSGTGKPVGRPTNYDAAYCQKVIDLGTEGYSIVEMAAEIGVARTTLERLWPEAHPEFLQALDEARDRSQAWWETQGRKNLTADKFQAALYSRSMAARFPNDWRESKQVEHKGGVTVTTGEHDAEL